MSRFSRLFIIILVVFAALFFVVRKKSLSALTIGILQTASHPALDAAREGFIKAVSAKRYNIAFVIKNAQGDLAAAQHIARQFKNDPSLHAFLAIATPAALSLAHIEKERPIIIAAVTDPEGLSIVGPLKNVTGSTDRVNILEAAQFLETTYPAAKNIGIIFNIGEKNSITLVEKMEKQLLQEGKTVVRLGVTSEAEIPAAADRGFATCDLLWAPTDNTVASTAALIGKKAKEHQKPFVASDLLLLQRGATAAFGVDYHEVGKKAGESALLILSHGKKPGEIPVAVATGKSALKNKEIS